MGTCHSSVKESSEIYPECMNTRTGINKTCEQTVTIRDVNETSKQYVRETNDTYNQETSDTHSQETSETYNQSVEKTIPGINKKSKECLDKTYESVMQSINSQIITHYVKPLESILGISNINNDDEIWNMLRSKGLFNHTYDYKNKFYAINICQNNLDFIRENFKYVQNLRMIENFIVLSAAFCIDIDITQFLIYHYTISNDIRKLKSNEISNLNNTCLYYAVALNPSLKMLRYLIEIIGADVNFQQYDILSEYQCGVNYKHIMYEVRRYNVCCGIIFSNLCNINDFEKSKYMIEDTNIHITLYPENLFIFNKIVPLIKNPEKLNVLLIQGFKNFSLNEMKSIIKSLDPLIINNEIRNLCRL